MYLLLAFVLSGTVLGGLCSLGVDSVIPLAAKTQIDIFPCIKGQNFQRSLTFMIQTSNIAANTLNNHKVNCQPLDCKLSR